MDAATQHMVGLLRTLAGELEMGNGIALDMAVDMPHGAGFGHGPMQYARTYKLSLTVAQPKPEVV